MAFLTTHQRLQNLPPPLKGTFYTCNLFARTLNCLARPGWVEGGDNRSEADSTATPPSLGKAEYNVLSHPLCPYLKHSWAMGIGIDVIMGKGWLGGGGGGVIF